MVYSADKISQSRSSLANRFRGQKKREVLEEARLPIVQSSPYLPRRPPQKEGTSIGSLLPLQKQQRERERSKDRLFRADASDSAIVGHTRRN
jgi:hypothetical protein